MNTESSRRGFLRSVALGATVASIEMPALAAHTSNRLDMLNASDFRDAINSDFSVATACGERSEVTLIAVHVQPSALQRRAHQSAVDIARASGRSFDLVFRARNAASLGACSETCTVSHATLGAGNLFLTASADGSTLHAVFNRLA
ncbi:MAG: DUF6916 family protein [Casimicrobium sp.]